VSYTPLGGDLGSAWTNRLKLALMLDFLGTTTAEFILGGDSSDVLLVRDPAIALAEFRRQDAGVLFNAEKNPWPKQLVEVKAFERPIAVESSRRSTEFAERSRRRGSRVTAALAFQPKAPLAPRPSTLLRPPLRRFAEPPPRPGAGSTFPRLTGARNDVSPPTCGPPLQSDAGEHGR